MLLKLAVIKHRHISKQLKIPLMISDIVKELLNLDDLAASQMVEHDLAYLQLCL